MSASRAIRPLFGVGSRLIGDPFFPKPARRAAQTLFSGASPTTLKRPPSPICWSCQHRNVAQQIRFSSSSSPKPPNDAGKDENYPLRDPLISTAASSSSPLPSSFSSSSSFSAAADSYTQDASSPESQGSEKGKQTEINKENTKTEQPPPSTPTLDLPSALNSRRSALNQSLSAFMDRAQTTLFTASQRINDLTGYSSIEALKAQISNLEDQLRAAQSNLTNARSAYKNAVSDRSSTQREVTTLLARQKTWTPIDFERFTTLYRQDYELEASVGERASELEQAEYDAERLARELGASILARYHEEQIWSDKIRRMSTWGTWGLMGVNILLFLLLQFGAEPWRRRRLVRGFEEKVREAIAEERVVREEAERAAAALAAERQAEAQIAEEQRLASAVPEPVVIPPVSDIPEPSHENGLPRISWHTALRDPAYLRSALEDLVSDRKIALRMRDISLIAAESVAIGAAMVGTIAIFMFRRT